MKSQYKTLNWLIILILLINACTPRLVQRVKPQLPDLGIPADEINKRIIIRAPVGINSFRTNSIMYIEIKLISHEVKDELAFNSDFGTRLYINQDGQWIEIKNNMQYTGGESQYFLSPTDKEVRPFVNTVLPNLSDYNKTVDLWIFVIGNIVKNGRVTNNKTGAYIEVELKP